jgi:predicted dithiol-disulfide oxidoreductase (DUF899 family)
VKNVNTWVGLDVHLQNQSEEYLAKRDELRLAEIELMRQRERVAELRRRLPAGAIVQDYASEKGPATLNAGDTPVLSVACANSNALQALLRT